VPSSTTHTPPARAVDGKLRTAAWALLAVNLARLLLGLGFELVPQEAYYFFWAQHPALSYFDHPPAIAYALWLSSALFGKSVFAIRFTAFALTAGTQLAFLSLARRFLPRARRRTALLLLATTPMVTLVSLVSTPDVPLLLFWTLSLLFLHDAIFRGRQWAWLAAGLFMGLAFDAKYSAAFLQVGLAAFLLASPRHRGLLKTRGPYLALLVAHLAILPVYVWNAQHEFLSFLFQTKERAIAAPPGLTLRFFFGLVGSQTALLLPPLLFALVGALVRLGPRIVLRPRRTRERPLFLLCFLVPMVVPFTALSLFAQVKPNWLYPSYLAGTLLVAALATRRVLRWNLALSAVFHAVAALEVLFYFVPLRSDDTWFGWRELARQVEARHAADPKAFLFSADSYKTTAELTFYLPNDRIWGENVLGFPALEYDFIPGPPYELIRQDAIWLDSAPLDSTPERAHKVPQPRNFEDCVQQEPILIRHRGAIVRKFFVYRCRGFRGPYYEGNP
jgi:4-amino-4-deoxy-L-arabinose transferase-like glycosyltransferase